MTQKNKNIIASLLFLAFGVFVYVEALGIKHMMKNDVGSAFFPKVVAICLIVTAIVKIVSTLLDKNVEVKKESGSDMVGGWATVALLIAYALLFQSIGFIISTAVYLFLQMVILFPKEKMNYVLIGIISVVTPLVIYVLFVYVISMPLPKGIFGF